MSHDRVGDVLVAQGKLFDALKSFREGLEIAGGSMGNPEIWLAARSVSVPRQNRRRASQRSLPDALKAFHEGMTIRQRLAKADPDNVDWQRGLAVSYDRLGDVLMAQDNLADALKAFQEQTPTERSTST